MARTKKKTYIVLLDTKFIGLRRVEFLGKNIDEVIEKVKMNIVNENNRFIGAWEKGV